MTKRFWTDNPLLFRSRVRSSLLALMVAVACALPGLCLIASLPVHADQPPPESGAAPLNVPPALPQVVGAVNPARTTPMQNNVRPEANAANDRGRVADDFRMDHMYLLLHRPAEQERALEQLMAGQTDPGSVYYHRWLAADEFREFGPAQSDIDAVTGWLQSEGFTVNQVFRNGMVIDFSGNAGQIHRAFHTEIHRLDVHGVKPMSQT